jgi:hypothetical protein
LDENRRPLHYFDCGECSILTGLKRMSAAKALRRS